MAMVIDPVCGMRIDPDDAAATVEHEGHDLLLLFRGLPRLFVATPDQFVS